MDTGEKIKYLRKQLGYSAEYIAEKIGVSPSTIYRYENNDIASMKIDNLKMIAKILHTDAMDLLGWYEDDPITVKVDPHDRSDDDILSASETVLIKNFRQLNDSGQRKAAEYVEDLAGNEKYTADQGSGDRSAASSEETA